MRKKYYVKYSWKRGELDEWHDECKDFNSLADAFWCTTDALARLHQPENSDVIMASIYIQNDWGRTIHYWPIHG